jgi:hypothetical protein
MDDPKGFAKFQPASVTIIREHLLYFAKFQPATFHSHLKINLLGTGIKLSIIRDCTLHIAKTWKALFFPA